MIIRWNLVNGRPEVTTSTETMRLEPTQDAQGKPDWRCATTQDTPTPVVELTVESMKRLAARNAELEWMLKKFEARDAEFVRNRKEQTEVCRGRDQAVKRAYAELNAMCRQTEAMRVAKDRENDSLKQALEAARRELAALKAADGLDRQTGKQEFQAVRWRAQTAENDLYRLRTEVTEQLYAKLPADRASEVLRHETQRLATEREKLAETVTKQRASLQVYEQVTASLRAENIALNTRVEAIQHDRRLEEQRHTQEARAIGIAKREERLREWSESFEYQQLTRQVKDLTASLESKSQLFERQLEGRQKLNDTLQLQVNTYREQIAKLKVELQHLRARLEKTHRLLGKCYVNLPLNVQGYLATDYAALSAAASE